ncbi:MAG: hypothetical protein P1U56_18915 [Saprospiraceae bacterium]|nr:hypothetical protein [Saprospiraceae bacterium]
MRKVKYYKIKNDLDPKIVGKDFGQIGYMKPNSQLFDAWEFPNIETSIQVSLNERSKVTDFLKCTLMDSNGHFINEKVKAIFDLHHLMQHKYYKAVLENYESLKYYWIHLLDLSILDKIDYAKSVFYRTEFGDREEIIALASYEQYTKLKKEKGVFFDVEVADLFLKVKEVYDLITILPFEHDMYVSEQLRNALKENDVDGIVFQEERIIHYC